MIVGSRFKTKRDTAQNWSSYNPVLLEGEIGIVTDAIEFKVGDGETEWNELPSFYKKDSLANAYIQKTKLNCTAGLKFSIPVNDNPAFLYAPLEVLKFFSSIESDTVITACSYDNSDSSSFTYNEDCVEFDGKMKIKKMELLLTFNNPVSLNNNGYICNAEIDFSTLQEITGYIPKEYKKLSDTLGVRFDGSEWEQYSEENDVISASIYVKNNTAYGITGEGTDTAVTQLSSNWSSLTDAEKLALFQNITGEFTTSDIVDFGSCTVYSYSVNSEVPVYKLVYIPLAQLVLPKGLISLAGFELSNVNILNSVTGNSQLKIAITTDLETYYTYNSTSGEFESLSGEISANLLLQEGISVSSLSSIPAEAWANTSAIGFAYVLSQTEDSENCYTDELVLTVTSNGSWKKAVHGTDYDYEYSGNSTATISVLTSGDYKVNYMS